MSRLPGVHGPRVPAPWSAQTLCPGSLECTEAPVQVCPWASVRMLRWEEAAQGHRACEQRCSQLLDGRLMPSPPKSCALLSPCGASCPQGDIPASCVRPWDGIPQRQPSKSLGLGSMVLGQVLWGH